MRLVLDKMKKSSLDDPSAAGAQPKLREGPIALSRRILKTARSTGAISIVYYFSHKFSNFRSTLPYLHFETGKLVSRHDVPPDHAEVLGRCHEFIIQLGKPIILSNFLTVFAEAEPDLTEQIITEANNIGVYDQYMVPVYGPYDINGVIAFGFGDQIPPHAKAILRKLEEAATAHHNSLVRYFGKHTKDIELSTRENEVLTWIARGKTKGEISTILDISVGSVDTYTRRIFEKMGVNDKVSAAVTGVTKGLVKTD